MIALAWDGEELIPPANRRAMVREARLRALATLDTEARDVERRAAAHPELADAAQRARAAYRALLRYHEAHP